MLNKLDITKNWLPRYTGMPLDRFGDYILLTNFNNYVHLFAEQFGCDVYGEDRTMPAATNDAGLSIINFGMGSSNAATVMDLLSSIRPKGVLFLGKCGGLKKSTEIGHLILPIAAIRGEGTSDDYLRERATTTSRRRCRPCPRSNCTSSFRTRSSRTASITGPGSSTRPTAGFGNMTRPSTSNSTP
jgi:hypothetical protein